MVIAIVIFVLVVGSVIFHFISPWWLTPIASNWTAIDQTIDITFWVTGFIFIAVNLFLAYVVFRYRYHKNRRAEYNPENRRLEGWLTVITSIGIIAMLAPGLLVWAQFVNVPPHADVIEVIGQQWHWRFRLPGNDRQLGRTATQLVNQNNPFGIDPDDPLGQDDILIESNELHLPVDRAVKVLLRSVDVLHNFTVPQFRVKMDMVPGLTTYLWFTPTRVGRFELLCQELCGMAHYTMRGHVVVDNEPEYQHWLSEQPTFSQSMARPGGDLVAGQKIYTSCAACHGPEAQGNQATGAPQLAGQATWYLNRQLNYFRDHIRGRAQDDLYGRQMQPFAAALSDDRAMINVTSYLNSLTTVATPGEISGDLAAGRRLYQHCALCHGEQAQGSYAQNAPQLAGQHDWYLKRQLANYQQNIRGSHPQDSYGPQMILMSKLLQNEQAIDDVVAYIATLEPTRKRLPATMTGG